jgi:hypothetical protein
VERHQFLTIAISEEPRPQVGASSNEKASWAWGLTSLNPHMGHSSPCTARGILAFSHKLPEYVLSGRDDPMCLYVLMFGAQGAVRSRSEFCGDRKKREPPWSMYSIHNAISGRTVLIRIRDFTQHPNCPIRAGVPGTRKEFIWVLTRIDIIKHSLIINAFSYIVDIQNR